MLYNSGQFKMDEYGDGRVEKTTVMHNTIVQTPKDTTSWIGAYID